MSLGRDIAIIDIDGVLCNVDFEFGTDTFKWKEYAEKDKQRKVLWRGVDLVEMFISSKITPVYLTARHEGMRQQTQDFLDSLDLWGDLIMSSCGSDEQPLDKQFQQKQAQIKREEVQKLVQMYTVLYAVDDQEANCRMYREFGIPTLKAMFTGNEF
mgnify:CR=1 FL=1